MDIIGKNKLPVIKRWSEKIEKNDLTIALNVLRAKNEYNIKYKNNIKIY